MAVLPCCLLPTSGDPGKSAQTGVYVRVAERAVRRVCVAPLDAGNHGAWLAALVGAGEEADELLDGPAGEPLGGNVLRRDRVQGLAAHADDQDVGDADQRLALLAAP